MPGCWLKSCPVNEEPLRVCANRRMCFREVAALVSSGMRLSSQRDFHLCSGEEKKKKWDNTALNLRGHYKATKDPISSASSLINHLFGYENTRSCNLGKRHHIISTKTWIKSSAIQKPILPTEMYSSNNVVLKTWIASFCGGNHFTFWSNIWKKLLYIAGGWERLITLVIMADERLIAHGTLGCVSRRLLEVQTAGLWGHITAD